MRRAGQPQARTPVKVLGEHADDIRKLKFRRQRSAGPRLVYGAVDDDGNIEDAGSGDWTVAWDTDNRYEITLDTPFNAPVKNVALAATNNLSAAGVDPGGYFVVTNISESTEDTLVVYVFDPIGDPADGSFSFVAIEAAA